VKHLDAPAGCRQGSAAGHQQPARRAPARPDALRTGYPAAPGPAAVLRRCVRRMNVSPDSVRVNGVVLGFLFRSGSAWGR
jgi:hypothetical protein